MDDLIITGGAYQLIADIKSNFSQEFEMKDLGDLHYCLGIAFWIESSKTFITQSKYAREILDIFQMSERKSISIPLDQNVKLYTIDGSKEVDGTLYRQLVGSLNYLTITNLDLSYSVSILSQFLAKPCQTHWKYAK